MPPATPPSVEVKDERLGHRPVNSDGDDHGGSLATPPSASRRGSSPFGSSDGTLGLRRRRHGSGTSGGRLSHKRAHRRRASSTASGASGDGIAAATARRGSRRGSRRRRGSSATGIEALGIGDTDDNELHKLTPPVSCYTSAALTARRRSRVCQLLTQLWWRPTLVLVVLLGWMARGILVVLALKVWHTSLLARVYNPSSSLPTTLTCCPHTLEAGACLCAHLWWLQTAAAAVDVEPAGSQATAVPELAKPAAVSQQLRMAAAQ